MATKGKFLMLLLFDAQFEWLHKGKHKVEDVEMLNTQEFYLFSFVVRSMKILEMFNKLSIHF